MLTSLRTLTAVVAAVGMAVLLAAPQAGATTTLQSQVDRELRSHPGSVKIGNSSIAWNRGNVVLDLARRSGRPDCPKAWTCLYNDRDWGYPRLRYYHCKATPLPTHWTPRDPHRVYGISSYHNNNTGNERMRIFDMAYVPILTARAGTAANIPRHHNDDTTYIRPCRI